MNYLIAFSGGGSAFGPPIVPRHRPAAVEPAPLAEPVIPQHPSQLPDDAMVDVKVAAIVTGLSKSTLNAKRSYGGGPVFVKYSSGAIRYSMRELRRWISINSTPSIGEHWAAAG